MATSAKTQRFKELVELYGLEASHFHKDTRGFIIVTREGIERIQAVLGCRVGFAPVPEFTDVATGMYCVKGFGRVRQEDGTFIQIESFGECSPKNNRNPYPIAMAEKRALSRVVLKAAGMYELGVYGEDELND